MLFPDESYLVMGACFEVHNRMGSGFLEAVYQECLAIEFGEVGIPFTSQPAVDLTYRGHKLEQIYRPDFICFERILIEIKAVDRLVQQHDAQVLNYLNATGLQLGILVNFGSHPKLEPRRLALSDRRRTT
ncbi:MAG: GxxExxY protein [Botrimarina sp.]